MDRYWREIDAARKAKLELAREMRESPQRFDSVVAGLMRACLDRLARAEVAQQAGAAFEQGMRAMRARAWAEAKVPPCAPPLALKAWIPPLSAAMARAWLLGRLGWLAARARPPHPPRRTAPHSSWRARRARSESPVARSGPAPNGGGRGPGLGGDADAAQAHFEAAQRLDPERQRVAAHVRACEERLPPADPAPVTSFYAKQAARGIAEPRDPLPGPEPPSQDLEPASGRGALAPLSESRAACLPASPPASVK
jgi:hypothetical protein